MKKIIVFAISGIIIYSCSNSTPKTGADASVSKLNLIENTNDMENAAAIIPSWNNEKTVVTMNEPAAHSGKYACVTNDTLEYSYTYAEQIKNINTGLPNKVDVSGWIYSTISKPNIAIILDVSENDKPYDWMAFPLADSLTVSGRWVEFNSTFYFSKPLNPEQVIKIFAWNQSKKTIYIDDLKFRFEF
jgi:hypothetical protein